MLVGLSRRSLLGAALSAPFALRAAAREARAAEAFLGKEWRVPKGPEVVVNALASGSLSATLSAIDDWSIPAGARLVFAFDDGNHSITEPVKFQHPGGPRISVRGNVRDPAKSRIVCEKPIDLFYIGMGQSLGQVQGLTFEHVSRANRGLGSAILADYGGSVLASPSVVIDGFYYGFTARRNGTIRAENTIARNGGDCNYFAFLGGHIYAKGAQSSDAKDERQGLGSGFVAEYGGSIDCEGAQSSYNLVAGFYALSNGSIRAYRTRAFRNGFAGYRELTGGVIVAHDSTAELNCGPGQASDRSDASYSARMNNAANNNAPRESCSRAP